MTTKTLTKRRVKQAAKSAEKVHAVQVPQQPRRLHLPAYRLLRFKRITYPERLPSAWRITKRSAALLWDNRWLFLKIAAIYGVLNIIFVRGLSGGLDVENLKQQVNSTLGGSGGLTTGLTVFATLLVSSGNNSSATAGAYQLFLGIIISLVTIWAIRHVSAGNSISARDAFYKSAYPLVQFILVLIVVLLQCVPLVIGSYLYSSVMSSGIAATMVEQVIWTLVCLGLVVASLYMLCSSLFALYIVTLPDMTPMKALRSARQLVRYRRGQIFRKLLFLPVVLFAVAAIIMVPIILVFAPAAQWILFALSMVSLITIHTYMYTIYKALLA